MHASACFVRVTCLLTSSACISGKLKNVNVHTTEFDFTNSSAMIYLTLFSLNNASLVSSFFPANVASHIIEVIFVIICMIFHPSNL